MPDVLLYRLLEIAEKKDALAATPPDQVKPELDKPDAFLDAYDVPTLGDWFSKGKQWLRPIECPWTDEHENPNQGTSTCVVYTEGGGYGFDCKHRCSEKTWQDFRAEVETRHPNKCFSFGTDAGPRVTIGGAKAEPAKVSDWRDLFHTRDAMLNAPPVSFLIKDFLQREGVTAIAAPVRERKSLIALNIVHALLTCDKLFDYFEVVKKPERVLYLCPEVSLGPFTDRVKRIGLMDYVGVSLFLPHA